MKMETSYTDDDDTPDDSSSIETAPSEASFPSSVKRDSLVETWLNRAAVLGDSPRALFASFLILVVAVGVSLFFQVEESYMAGGWVSYLPAKLAVIVFQSLPSQSTRSTLTIFDLSSNLDLSPAILEAFDRDGVIAVRGIFSPEEIKVLQETSHGLIRDPTSEDLPRGRQFHSVQHGAIFRNVSIDSEGAKVYNVSDHALLKAALSGRLAKVVAQIMRFAEEHATNDTSHGFSASSNNIRLLRDILLSKDNHHSSIKSSCGWHVDDTGFWPAQPNAAGVNAWVALDDYSYYDEDITNKNGVKHEATVPVAGGLALAVGSHRADWRYKAYEATGAPPTSLPNCGYTDMADLVEKRKNGGTCQLQQNAPELHEAMEASMRIYPTRPGDIVLHTRWLFHRTALPTHSTRQPAQVQAHKRYSLRFSPGTAIIPPGYGTEWSVLFDEANGGRTANEVSKESGPWYPQVWPSVRPDEIEKLPQMLLDQRPVAQKRHDDRARYMTTYIRNQARTKQATKPHNL